MARLEVRLLGDPILREKAVEVKQITDATLRLIEDMFETMYAEEGVGLAAPQVGVSERIIVVDPRDDVTERFALINPVIVETGHETDRDEEGCLSIPGLKDIVERPATVVVEGLTPSGEQRRIEAAGLLARILQHEIDHIDGILFIDRLSPLKRKLALSKWQKVKPSA